MNFKGKESPVIIKLPPKAMLANVYAKDAEAEKARIADVFSQKVEQTLNSNRQWVSNAPYGTLLAPERAQIVVSNEMTKELSSYQEQMALAMEQYEREQHPGNLCGEMNDVLAKLTGYRLFIDDLPTSVPHPQKASMDKRLLSEMERTLHSVTKAVLKQGVLPFFSSGAYTLKDV